MRRSTRTRRRVATTCTTTTSRRRPAARRGGRRGRLTASASPSRWTGRSGRSRSAARWRRSWSTPRASTSQCRSSRPTASWLAYTADDDAKSINLRLLNVATGAVGRAHDRAARQPRAGVVTRRPAPGLRLHRAQRLLQRVRDGDRGRQGRAGACRSRPTTLVRPRPPLLRRRGRAHLARRGRPTAVSCCWSRTAASRSARAASGGCRWSRT